MTQFPPLADTISSSVNTICQLYRKIKEKENYHTQLCSLFQNEHVPTLVTPRSLSNSFETANNSSPTSTTVEEEEVLDEIDMQG